MTDFIGNGFVLLSYSFLEDIVAPQLGQITLRNGEQDFHFNDFPQLLSAGKNFVPRFFSIGTASPVTKL